MRVYVGTYAKYNSGSLAGEWLDLEDYSDKAEFYAACKELHANEPDPEFMFQDWEDIPEGMIGESHICEEAFEVAAMDEDERKLITVYRAHVNQEGTLEEAQEAFRGTHKSPEDYAWEFTEECGYLEKVPAFLQCHIDWQGVARDMGHDGVTFVSVDGDTWVFSA